jgi:hypothetical protein
MKFDKDGNPIVETTVTPTDETPSETPVFDEKKIASLIEQNVKNVFETYMKSLSQTPQVTPTVTPTDKTPEVKPQPVDIESVITSKLSEYEKKLDEKYEKKSFIASLTQSQFEFLKDIENYEMLSLNQIKKILSKVSLPTIENQTVGVESEDINSLISKLRPRK